MYFNDSDDDFEIDPEDYYGHEYFDFMFDDMCGLYDQNLDNSDYYDEDDDDNVEDFYFKSYLPEEELSQMKRCQAICAGMHQDRSEGLFCDANIVVEDKTFAVHKTVLKASSSYFTAMFTGAFSEKNESEVHIRGISSDVFAILLDYMYGAKINLTFENVKEIYLAGDMLCIDALITDCKTYIKSNWVSAQDIQSVFEMAKEFGLEEVTKDIIHQGRTHLVSFMGEKDYRELSDSFLLTILEGRNTLKYLEKEKMVANYLVKWVFFKPDERLPSAAFKVFTAIHFEFIIREEFADILKLIRSFEEVSSELLNSFVASLEEMYESSHQKFIDQQVTMVLPDISENDFCGVFRLHKFHFQEWKWEADLCEISKVPQSFIVSKYDLFVFTKEGCTKFNLLSKQKHDLPNFPTKRTMSVFSVCGNDVYVTGGYKDGSNKPLGEILKLSNGHWTPSIVWRQPKSEASSITHGQFIYLVGGRNLTKKVSEQAQCFSFNTLTRYFRKICNLNFPVLRPKLAIHNDILYIFSYEHLHSETSVVQGVDLKRHELMPQSAFKGLELKYPILGVTSVSTGLLIAYSMENKILLGLYRPNEEECMEFLGVVAKPTLEGLYRPITQYQLLFYGHSST